MILLYGPNERLLEGFHALQERGWNAQRRSFRAFHFHPYAEPHVSRVILMEENDKIRKAYEAEGVPVEVHGDLHMPEVTREEVEAMPFFKKKATLKRLTGVSARNSLETDHLIRQHFDGR
jgi:hypothetical protein